MEMRISFKGRKLVNDFHIEKMGNKVLFFEDLSLKSLEQVVLPQSKI